MSKKIYRLPDPYPVPEHLAPNPRYARILSAAYGGPKSEITAIAQYIYNHIELKEECPQVSECMRQIAIVEMRHLDLLGSCVKQLGLPPQYRSFHQGRPKAWSASSVPYQTGIHQILMASLEGEKQAVARYHKILKVVKDDQISELIHRIIQDEELHIKLFQSML